MRPHGAGGRTGGGQTAATGGKQRTATTGRSWGAAMAGVDGRHRAGPRQAAGGGCCCDGQLLPLPRQRLDGRVAATGGDDDGEAATAATTRSGTDGRK